MSLTSKLKNTWNYTKDFFKPKNIILTTTLIGAAIFSNETNAQSGQAHINGRVTSGQTSQGMPNVEVLYNQITPETDTIITTTNNNGEYNFNITDVEDEQNTETTDAIKYYTNRIETNLEIKTFKLYNSIGELVQEATPENNNITPQINNLANGIYLIDIITDKEIYRNKLAIGEGKILGAGKNTTKITQNKKLDKILQEYTFTIEFRDQTETHHPYIILDYEPLTLPATYKFNTPLLPKGDIEIPFTNPRNGEQITTNRDLLFYVQGVDILLYAAYLSTVKPLKTHLNIQNLPPQYTETQIREATLDILTETGLPLDSIWQETTEYINPILVPESTIGYIFSDSASMGGTDLIIHNIISNQTGKRSYQFQFNTDTIEPEYIKKFIKHAWYVGITGSRVPAEGYFSQEPRNGIDTLTESERIQFRTLFSAPSMAETDIPWWISDENIPENNYSRPEHKATKQELEQFLNEQQKSYALYFKQVGDTYEMTKKILEEKDLKFK